MKRHILEKRTDFQKRLEEIGFNYWNLPSGPEKLPYWQEGVTYAFSETQIDKIQDASQQLHNMSIEMVSSIVKSGDYPAYFNLDSHSIPLIEQSWNRGDQSLYGRFDLVYDGNDQIKMLEYNGDTPVSILECAVAQWHYIEKCKSLPEHLRIQYNLIEETLIETWKERFHPNTLIHFTASADFRHEDWGNMNYIMHTALEAGMKVKEIVMEKIGHAETGVFVDEQEILIDFLFKLYPWEWMTKEPFGKEIINCSTRFMEPAWKMLLSNKAMLVKLWEMFPHHPNLLESYSQKQFDRYITDGKWCKKAIHGREGANIYQVQRQNGVTLSDELAQGSNFVSDYTPWGYMYQKWHNLPVHDGFRPIIGSWIIGDKACGMSIREDQNLVTGDNAFFASHYFVPYDHEEQYKDLYTNSNS